MFLKPRSAHSSYAAAGVFSSNVCPTSRRAEWLAGDMDLNPETGQYRLSASVPDVEANDLRKTLAIRPLPFPVGGAVRGVLHCTGPLETPVFSGYHILLAICPQGL